MEFNECLKAVKRYIWVIVFVSLISAVSAWAVSKFYLEKVYESSSTIILSGKTYSNDTKLQDVLLLPNYIKAFYDFAVSYTVAEKTISILNNSETVEDLRKKMSVKIDFETGVMKILAKSNNAQLSKKIVQAFIDSLKVKSEAQILNVNLHIVDPPQLPLLPSSPNTTLNILLSLTGGIMLGILLAFLFFYIEQSKCEVLELKKIPSLFVIGYLPKISSLKNKKLPIIIAEMLKEDTIKSILANLQFLTEKKDIKTIMITSPRPLEGKTTFALNIASSLAKLNKRVLLVDCNFQRPSLHKLDFYETIKASSNFKLLNDYRVKTIETLEIDIMTDVMVPQDVKGLNITLLKSMLYELESFYDFILIDSPEIIANSSSIMISRIVKNAIIVSDYKKLSHHLLEKCINRISLLGSDTLGIVVNRTPKVKIN